MKDIGAKLREARESIDISVDEAANDLKVANSQIENIEAGNLEAFQDIFYLKYFIRDYAKYLGLKYDELVDEFNEYLFDYTSKISIDDIEEAKKKELEKEEQTKIKSPYTIDYGKTNYMKLVLICLAVVVVIVAFVFIVR